MPGVQFGQQIDMNSFKITELAPGVAGTDAVNVNQLTASSPQGFAQDIGDGVALTYTVTHNFGTLDVIIDVFEKATNHSVFADISRSNVNDAVIAFGAAIPLNSHRVLIIPVP